MFGGVLMPDPIREKGILKYAAAKANIPNLHVGCRQAYQANQGEVKFCLNIIFGLAAGEAAEDALHQGLRGTGGRMTAFVKIRAVHREPASPDITFRQRLQIKGGFAFISLHVAEVEQGGRGVEYPACRRSAERGEFN